MVRHTHVGHARATVHLLYCVFFPSPSGVMADEQRPLSFCTDAAFYLLFFVHVRAILVGPISILDPF